MKKRTLLAGCVLAFAATLASAQVLPPPQNVLQLQASGSVEVQQDLLSVTLSTTREGADPASVQAELKSALDAALAEAKRAAQAGQMDVRTGNFSLLPQRGRDGRITTWSGSAELVLEGRDFARITRTAGRIQTLTVAGVGFGLSREQRAQVEGQAQAQAVDAFKARAGELAHAFGFAGYTLREVSVNTNDSGFVPRMRMAAASGVAPAAAPLPVEAGRSTVTVTVSGSVQMR